MGRSSRLGASLKGVFILERLEADATEEVELPLNQQYRIPPPEEDDSTLMHGMRAFASLRFMDLCVWVSVFWATCY